MFEKFGPLVKCKLNMRNGQSAGTAFVEYEDAGDALSGLKSCNGKRLEDKKIWCEFSGQSKGKGKAVP